jgi:hypothetical protein
MTILIYNFDAVNPLAHEWAHILADRNLNVTLVNHRKSIDCTYESIKILEINDFQPKFSDRYEFIFLPWLPPRKTINKFLIDWMKMGFPYIFWIDHNPVRNRDKVGILLRILRKRKIMRVMRLTHGKNSFESLKINEMYFPHPIFLNAFENTETLDASTSKADLNLAFVGRLDKQKGLSKLPHLTRLISEGTGTSIKWIIAGNNPNMCAVEETIKELEEIPRVSIESYIYGKKCPDHFIKHALSESDFMIAPYLQVTASGTISLAIALDTETISLSEKYPLGLDLFKDKSIHCLSEGNLVSFINKSIRGKEQNGIIRDYKREKNEHNNFCGDNLLNLVAKIKELQR